MSRKIKFDSSQNPALNFAVIVSDLRKISRDTNIPMPNIIQDFITDLNNYYSEDYNKKVEDIEINGAVSPKLLKDLEAYLKKTLKADKKREQTLSKKENNKEKKSAFEQEANEELKKIKASVEGDITDSEYVKKILLEIEKSPIGGKGRKYMRMKFDGEVDRFNQTWSEIEDMVESLSKTSTGKTKPEYWEAIKDIIAKGKCIKINMNDEMKSKMLMMIDDKIQDEKDNIYFEQVKQFTCGFQFLRDYSEVQQAVNGIRGIKFTDKESFNRFFDLRSALQEGYQTEYVQIQMLLKDKKLDKGDKRILLARKEVMDREREAKMALEAK